jgi:hypothetical protein
MHEQASRSRAGGGRGLQRAVVLALLGADGPDGMTCEELGFELDADAAEVEAAVRALHEDGVLSAMQPRVSASRAARRLDELGLIAV